MAEVAGPVREDFMLGEGGKSKKNLALSYLNSIKGNDALIVAIANKLTGEGTATPATAWSTIKEKAADPPAVFGGSGPSKYAALVDFAKALVVQPPPLTPAQQAAKDAAEVLATQAAAHAQKAADEKAAAAALALRCADYGKHAADVTVALFPTYGTTPHGAAAVHEAVSRICYGGAKDPLIAVAHRSALLKDLTDAQYAALKEQQGHAILDMVHVLISLPAPGAPPAPPPLPSLGGGSAGGGTVVSAVTQKALDAARASAAAATKAVDLIVPRVELPLTIMRENAWELAARSVHVPLLDLSLVVDEVSKEMGWVVLPAAHTLLTTKAMDPPTPLPADLIAKAWAAAAEAHSLAHDVARPHAFRGGRLMSLLTRQVAAHPPSGVATPAELKAYITRTVESVHHLECASCPHHCGPHVVGDDVGDGGVGDGGPAAAHGGRTHHLPEWGGGRRRGGRGRGSARRGASGDHRRGRPRGGRHFPRRGALLGVESRGEGEAVRLARGSHDTGSSSALGAILGSVVRRQARTRAPPHGPPRQRLRHQSGTRAAR
jgi:hypothetical protein